VKQGGEVKKPFLVKDMETTLCSTNC